MFENPRRGRQPKNFTTNVPKILDLKSSSEQIFSENCRWVPPSCPEFKSSATLVSSQGCLLPVEFLILLCSVWITCFKLFECSACNWWTKCTFHYKQNISTTWRIMSVTKISFFLRRACFFAAKILTFFHLVLLFFICE